MEPTVHRRVGQGERGDRAQGRGCRGRERDDREPGRGQQKGLEHCMEQGRVWGNLVSFVGVTPHRVVDCSHPGH